MKVSYYPGCDLYTKARVLNDSIQRSFNAVGFELKEMENWYCCGTTFTLARDNKMSLIAPLRILAKVQKDGGSVLVPCSICYNTLKRSNFIFKNDPETLRLINEHLGESYDGQVKIIHPFEFIRANQNDFKKGVKRNLENLKLGCYYGCYLLRPENEMEFDDPESPTIMEDFVKLMGAQPVSFPLKVECCGSYLIVSSPEAAIETSYRILKNARERGAEAIVTSCPVCHYNLDNFQNRMASSHPEHRPIPVFYFSQIMAMAYDLPVEIWGLEYNKISAVNLLKGHGIL
ncbi:MAG: CoB--CoM heterodisulfide reductase iron-sulfur subunit B family protein [candidate division WOR-3 bacterium]|nr:CoB--CoM heterodisulfide reductase iron-sulfur subunit B family protein [candidate division WOR-3 bacterium]